MFVLGDLEKEIVRLEQLMQQSEQLKIRIRPNSKHDKYFVNLVAALSCTDDFPYSISDGEEALDNGNRVLDYLVFRKK